MGKVFEGLKVVDLHYSTEWSVLYNVFRRLRCRCH